MSKHIIRWSMGLVAVALLAGCGAPTKLKLAPQISTVTATSAEQAGADRKQIIALLDGLATQHGLTKETGALEGLLAAYAAPPNKLGLSVAVVAEGSGETITTVAISPVALGLELNSSRKSFIQAVNAALKQAFGERCKTAS